MPLKAAKKKVSYSSLDAMSKEAPALGAANGGARLAQRDSAVDLSDRVTDATRLRCRRVILIRHVLAALAERMFEFAIMVLLTVVRKIPFWSPPTKKAAHRITASFLWQVGPGDSFGLIAAYGITINLMVALFSPGLGAKLDRADRLKSVTVVTVVQNVCTATCAAILLLLLYTGIGKPALTNLYLDKASCLPHLCHCNGFGCPVRDAPPVCVCVQAPRSGCGTAWCA